MMNEIVSRVPPNIENAVLAIQFFHKKLQEDFAISCQIPKFAKTKKDCLFRQSKNIV
ncbi:MAG: hypothetical protein IJU76_14125 [Desulfovibrionaceae bacterium]|nr:hypothetical protein [Desulfovibrionaceae bacterium]